MSIIFPSEQEIQQNLFLVSAATVSVTANSPLIEQWNVELKIVATVVFNGFIPLPIGEAVQTWKINGLLLRRRLMNAASRRMLQGPA
jgi:hypothetical protein